MGKEEKVSSQRTQNGDKDNHCHGNDNDGFEPPLEATAKREGWMLIIVGLFTIIFVAVSPHHLLYWYYFILQVGIASIAIAAGLKLIRPNKLVPSDKNRRTDSQLGSPRAVLDRIGIRRSGRRLK